MTNKIEEQAEPYSLDEVVNFLCGASSLDGVWFGELRPDRPVFWWRKHLRASVEADRAKQKEKWEKAIGNDMDIAIFDEGSKEYYMAIGYNDAKEHIRYRLAHLSSKEQETPNE